MTAPTPQEINAALAVGVFGFVWAHGNVLGCLQSTLMDPKEADFPWFTVCYEGQRQKHENPYNDVPNFHGDSTESDRLVDAMVARGWEACITFEKDGVLASFYMPDGSHRVYSDIKETRPAAVAEAVYRALGLGVSDALV